MQPLSLTSEYLLYLIVFRLGIITAGTISIVLGYRLFVRGQWNIGTQRNSLDAKVAGARFTLKNAAPGTGFGIFGVILITVMLLQGRPELTYETLKRAAADEDTISSKMAMHNPDRPERLASLLRAGIDSQKKRILQRPTYRQSLTDKNMISSRIVMRGSDRLDRFASLVETGVNNQEKGNTPEAIAAYREALIGATIPMNQLAWIYLKQGKIEEALPLARLAVQLNPTNADILDTLADILSKRGEQEEARQLREKAAGLDSRYRSKLDDLKTGHGE